MITEIAGIICLILGVTGVILNNRRMRICFIVWMISNAMSACIHMGSEIWSLLIRDVIFLILAFEGWIKWGKKK